MRESLRIAVTSERAQSERVSASAGPTSKSEADLEVSSRLSSAAASAGRFSDSEKRHVCYPMRAVRCNLSDQTADAD